MSIAIKSISARQIKRAQAAAMALRNVDNSIAFTTRAGGAWENEQRTIDAKDQTIRVLQVFAIGDSIQIDVVVGREQVVGMRPGAGAFITVEIMQYKSGRKKQS